MSTYHEYFIENLRKKYIPDTFFNSTLIEWYEENKRNLPWRLTRNPYFIWLSEIILQQTRVDQGMPYYKSFIDKYPRLESLANAHEDEVLKLWQGLGYYSRARNLHATAKYIVDSYDGIFPTDYKAVLSLKGVGEYTAAAIMSFAYNEAYAAVDGNVYRILSRIFGIEEVIDSTLGKKVFQQLATALMDEKRPALFNQATMEFGAIQCVPKSPNCSICPFQDKCFAYNNNLIDVLPKKKGKVEVRHRYFNYLDIRVGEFAFLKKRGVKDIWEGLYEFPLVETDGSIGLEDLNRLDAFSGFIANGGSVDITHRGVYKHVLSHQVIHATFYQISLDRFHDDRYEKIEVENIDDYAVSRLIHKYLEDL